MNKLSLVNEVAAQLEISKKEANAIIDIVFEQIERTLISRNEKGIQIKGFGTFKTTYKRAREGRNPFTGEIIKIPAKTKIVFRPAKALKEKVL